MAKCQVVKRGGCLPRCLLAECFGVDMKEWALYEWDPEGGKGGRDEDKGVKKLEAEEGVMRRS
jgi:hypothetical protein